MKIMGKFIDKMMEDNDKDVYEEMMPALTIKVSTDGSATVTKDQDEKEKVEDHSPEEVEEKE